ncbi:MAG: carbohydrate-binding protein, partial [Butyricicoccus sp.]
MENRIYVVDQNGVTKAELSGPDEVILAWKGEYEAGDVIHMEFSAPGFYMIRVDDCVDDSLVYMAQQTLRYPVIFDEKKKAHNPKSFTGERHYIAMRPARPWELGYRNLAKNPADQHDVVGCYPHASA